MKVTIVRYGEISLKRGRRKYFIEKLKSNLRNKLMNYNAKLRQVQGRIIIEGEIPVEIVAKTPGVVSVSSAEIVDEEEIESYLEKFSNIRPSSFRVFVQRVDKSYPKNSLQIAREIGNIIRKKFDWRVDLNNPEFTLFIEVIEGKFYVFTEKVKGIGGLPVGTQGKLVALLSGGIDSPVASFFMMRRGAEIVALHFSSKGTEATVSRIVKKLGEIHNVDLIVEDHRKLIEPYIDRLQTMNRKEWTCIVCKSLMIKRASELAKEIGALGIVTGDSLGQVASQTLDNLYLESMMATVPIYRPLIGLDKAEIEKIAREIGTYDLASNTRCPFSQRRVITRGNPQEFVRIAKEIGLLA